MMLGLLLLLGAQDVPAATITRERSKSVTIPDEIAPAVFPYLRCLSDGFNAESKKHGAVLDGGALKSANVAARSGCAKERVEAKTQAEQLLKKQGSAPAADRAKLIEDALTGVEGIFEDTNPPAPASGN